MFSPWMTFLCLKVELLSSTSNLNTLFIFWDETLKNTERLLLSTQECVKKSTQIVQLKESIFQSCLL